VRHSVSRFRLRLSGTGTLVYPEARRTCALLLGSGFHQPRPSPRYRPPARATAFATTSCTNLRPHLRLKRVRRPQRFTSRESQITSHGILIETPRLKFPANTTKLSPLPISNRDKMRLLHPACLGGMGTFMVAAIPLAPHRNRLFRQTAEPKDRPSPALTERFTSHESRIASHEFLSPPPITFSPSTPVLDFAQQFCSEENFPAITANRWNFGLCATIPREPRQARKGATVTGQLRVPRNTRSSSLALLKLAAGFSRLPINGVPTILRIDISPKHHAGSRVASHKLRVTDSR
jgi:hypothetical protein